MVRSTEFAGTAFGMPCGFALGVDNFPKWGSLLRLLWCENTMMGMLLHKAGVHGSAVSAGVSPWLLLEARSVAECSVMRLVISFVPVWAVLAKFWPFWA